MSKKVLLGMSGGVDSSVAAIILKQQGYEVIGITMNLLCGEDESSSLSSSLDAKNVCEILGIEHYDMDSRNEFNKYVIKDFICQYKNCKTPNPCIECNRHLKFGAMYEKAKELGCDYIATGHYARIEYNEKYNRKVIKKADAENKDQSYVLYNVSSDVLDKILFPLADFNNKEEIREIARKNNLQIANKPDSEDICFIPDGDYKKFLEENSDIRKKQGNIVNKEGKILGQHEGLYRYTIGQRRGLGISYKEPLFVTGFDEENNNLIVGTQDELYSKELIAYDINLQAIEELKEPMEVRAKIRYKAKEAKAIIYPLEKEKIKVVFEEPQKSITPGQSVVFYDNDIVIGGGKIEKIGKIGDGDC